MWTIATSEKYIHHVCLCTSLLLQFLWKHAKCSDISIVMTKYIILLLGIWSSIDCSTCWWTASYVLRLRQIPFVGSFAGWVGKSQVHTYQYLAHLWVRHSYISHNTPLPLPPPNLALPFVFEFLWQQKFKKMLDMQTFGGHTRCTIDYGLFSNPP